MQVLRMAISMVVRFRSRASDSLDWGRAEHDFEQGEGHEIVKMEKATMFQRGKSIDTNRSLALQIKETLLKVGGRNLLTIHGEIPLQCIGQAGGESAGKIIQNDIEVGHPHFAGTLGPLIGLEEIDLF